MALTPEQRSISIKYYAYTLTYLGLGFVGFGLLPVFGVRFDEHQMAWGLGVGIVLILIARRLLRYLPARTD